MNNPSIFTQFVSFNLIFIKSISLAAAQAAFQLEVSVFQNGQSIRELRVQHQGPLLGLHQRRKAESNQSGDFLCVRHTG